MKHHSITPTHQTSWQTNATERNDWNLIKIDPSNHHYDKVLEVPAISHDIITSSNRHPSSSARGWIYRPAAQTGTRTHIWQFEPKIEFIEHGGRGRGVGGLCVSRCHFRRSTATAFFWGGGQRELIVFAVVAGQYWSLGPGFDDVLEAKRENSSEVLGV